MRSAITGLAISAILIIPAPGQAADADGKAIYKKTCAACHNGLSPKLGDKAAWAPRLKQGVDALVTSAMKGKGGMPPKGGNTALSKDDIKAAVDYMVSEVK